MGHRKNYLGIRVNGAWLGKSKVINFSAGIAGHIHIYTSVRTPVELNDLCRAQVLRDLTNFIECIFCFFGFFVKPVFELGRRDRNICCETDYSAQTDRPRNGHQTSKTCTHCRVFNGMPHYLIWVSQRLNSRLCSDRS